MSESKALVRGTFLLTASILITKVIGILYLIPFYAIIGDEKILPHLHMLINHTQS